MSVLSECSVPRPASRPSTARPAPPYMNFAALTTVVGMGSRPGAGQGRGPVGMPLRPRGPVLPGAGREPVGVPPVLAPPGTRLGGGVPEPREFVDPPEFL